MTFLESFSRGPFEDLYGNKLFMSHEAVTITTVDSCLFFLHPALPQGRKDAATILAFLALRLGRARCWCADGVERNGDNTCAL